MSDESDNISSEVIHVIKLVTGEEIVGILTSDTNNVYCISFPARVDVHYGKGPEGMTEFVKLSNYAASVSNFKINIPQSATVFVGKPNDELRLMYLTYCEYMRQNPKIIISSAGEDSATQNEMHGLELLNDLFNNADFVEFVNELIENYEGVSIEEEDDEDSVEEIEELIETKEVEEPEIIPKKKKKKIKPESNKLPYNPDAPPNTAEGWSDNPNDYLS
jgi:hypothetical protein